ncbi:hypothetical protein TWF106_009561 [Orbilia oligospora]|uniref:Uncharacterized protein n=1 Tax=Orbilia oligospora TaxID=2813651 RepID=A0A7C8UL26_ORBOL|nr:hypothetical protein TWF106_009561 [Orbilia oligospora]
MPNLVLGPDARTPTKVPNPNIEESSKAMKHLPLPPQHLQHLQILSHEISNLHRVKTSLPSTHPVLEEDFDPDIVIKPILSTYYHQFSRLFDGKEHSNMWIGFNSALLKVWEWGDVEMAVDGFWDTVEEYFAVKKEDRIITTNSKPKSKESARMSEVVSYPLSEGHVYRE